MVDDHLRATRQFPDLDRIGRMAWIRRARHEDLEPSASAGGDGDALLAVLRGTVLIQQGATQTSAAAPIVIAPDASTRITVTTAARVAHVPPLDA